MHPHVYKSGGIRAGKGFTFEEIAEAGLSDRDIKRLAIRFDRKRKTKHDFNVDMLKKLREEASRPAPEIAFEKPAPIMEKHKEEKAKKKEEKETKPKERRIEKAKEKKGKGVPLTELKGVGKKKAEEFEKAGVKDIEDLLQCDALKISGKTSFSGEYIEKLKKEAEKL